MTDLDIEEFKRELLIASDVRSFIELLQRVFDEERSERGLTKSDLAKLVERDLSYVSRVINGRKKNVTLQTLALFMRAMGRRLEPSESRLVDLGALQPLREFMIRQTREKDLALMVEVSGSEQPSTVDDINSVLMVPAFMLSELKTAFEIGFAIFIPFLLIDIVVASILMSMGMLMVPPLMISLPIKIMMFVLIDGWNLVVSSLMSSFN